MRSELSLLAVIIILFVYDLVAGERGRRYMHPLACVLLLAHVLVNIVPQADTLELFGGMYRSVPMISLVKTILSVGTLVAVMQSGEWLRREDTRYKQGEFYVLTLFTLLGMFFMESPPSGRWKIC